MRIDYPRSGADGWRRYVPSWRQWLALGGAGVLALVVGFVVLYVTIDVPQPSALATAESTTFTYADGSYLGRDGAQNRQIVGLKDIPLDARFAVLAAEDRNFYHEPGISPSGIARALWVDLRGGDVTQGGSTITQQYAKNAYLTQARTITRKLKEIVISLKLSHQRSKDQILQDYLNTIYFGRGAYGIEAAAQAYFGEHASRLTVSQAALLAAVIRAPAFYDPSVDAAHAAAAKARWRYVLGGMVDEGWLSPTRAAKQKFPPRGLRPNGGGSSLAGPNGYVIRAAEAEMERHGISEDRINLGGLHVTLTLSRKAQAAAKHAMGTVLHGAPKDLHSALVAVEPGTGRVRALYGGRDYQTRQLDDAFQQIEPGSSFKPYTLVAALQKGIPLSRTYSGRSPQTFGGAVIHNFSDEQFGRINLVTATAQSVNTVFVPLGIDAGGPSTVAGVASKAGITTQLYPDHDGASLFLGGLFHGVRPIDQADAYATFADQGEHASPYLVQKVTDRNGKVIYRAFPKADRVFDKNVMADTTYALQAPIRSGTATAAQLAGGRPAAGKTGTTTNNQSAWFVGFTPQLSAAVAMYRGQGTPNDHLTNILGYGEVTGGTLPARAWKAFMDEALAGTPIEAFPPPGRVGLPSPGPSVQPTATAGSPGTSTSPVPTHSPLPGPTVTAPPTLPPTRSPTPTPTPTPSPTSAGQGPPGGH